LYRSEYISMLKKLKKILGGRVARNLYFWTCCLLFSLNMNASNERIYHYGITSSPWYIPVIAGSLFLQCILVYTNNVVLLPKLLARQRRVAYAILMLSLALSISIFTVVLFKAARPHLNVQELQHPGLTSTVISPVWSLQAIAAEFPIFLFTNLMWILVFTMTWYMNDYSRQRRALRMAEEQRVRAELAFLKNQINPHFLFNTLNNIYGLALQKADSTPDVILRLSAMLRYLLYDSEQPDISFEKEKAAIEAYVEIEALRLPEEATIMLDLYADGEYHIPSLLWMPMLENAFKHGTRLIHEPVSVNFSFRIEKNVATMRTINNFEPVTVTRATANGIGLTNLRKRLDLLFPGRYHFEQNKTGTVAIFDLKIYLT